MLTLRFELTFVMLHECHLRLQTVPGCQYSKRRSSSYGNIPLEAAIDLTVGSRLRPDTEVLNKVSDEASTALDFVRHREN